MHWHNCHVWNTQHWTDSKFTWMLSSSNSAQSQTVLVYCYDVTHMCHRLLSADTSLTLTFRCHSADLWNLHIEVLAERPIVDLGVVNRCQVLQHTVIHGGSETFSTHTQSNNSYMVAQKFSQCYCSQCTVTDDSSKVWHIDVSASMSNLSLDVDTNNYNKCIK